MHGFQLESGAKGTPEFILIIYVTDINMKSDFRQFLHDLFETFDSYYMIPSTHNMNHKKRKPAVVPYFSHRKRNLLHMSSTTNKKKTPHHLKGIPPGENISYHREIQFLR